MVMSTYFWRTLLLAVVVLAFLLLGTRADLNGTESHRRLGGGFRGRQAKGGKKGQPAAQKPVVNRCLADSSLCAHFCQPYPNGKYVCKCDKGYVLGKDKSSCKPRCDKGYRADPFGSECVPILSTCTYPPGTPRRYHNLEAIGRGVDLMSVDPFSGGSQEGIRNGIFEVFGMNERGTYQEGFGYSISPSYQCESKETVEKFNSLNSLINGMKKLTSEANLDEEPDMDVTSMKSLAETLKSIQQKQEQLQGGQSFGKGGENVTSHSKGGSHSQGKEDSQQQGGSSSSQGCISNTRGVTIADSSMEGNSTQKSTTRVVESRRRMMTVGRGKATGVQKGRSKGRIFASLLSAGLGLASSIFGMAFKGLVKPKPKVLTKTTNTFGTINQNAHSESNMKQSTSQDCNSNTMTNQRGLRLMEELTRNYQAAQMASQSFQQQLSLEGLLAAVYANEQGQTLQNGQNVRQTIKGFKDQFVKSRSFLDAMEFYKATEGSFFVAKAKCVHYKATIQGSTMPVFTDNFAKKVRKLHTYSALYGHLRSKAAEQLFNGLFKNFVREFGTHYSYSVTMGSSLVATQVVTKEEMKNQKKTDIEDCARKLLVQRKPENAEGSKGKEKKWCDKPGYNTVVVNSKERRRTQIVSRGNLLITENMRDWSKVQDMTKSAAISYKLKPIVTLFNSEFMSIDRIATRDGKPILTHAILGWMYPRYVNICKMYSKKGSEDLCAKMKGCFWAGKACEKTEKCIDEPKTEKGYRCEFAGCPKDPESDICPEPGKVCVEDMKSPKNYSCVDVCGKGNECREHVEQCVRNTTTMKKHSCIYKGCPDPNVVDLCPSRQEKCWPEPESKKGYECVENCHKVNCTDVEECNKDTGVCEYKGCKAGKVSCKKKTDVCIDNLKDPKKYSCIDEDTKKIIFLSGGYLPWAPWSPCSASCGQGMKNRTRACSFMGDWPDQCYLMPNNESAICNDMECPKWSEWGKCTASCGNGTQTRTRCQGEKWKDVQKKCGKLNDTKSCNLKQCLGGTWSEWTGYCSETCGEGTVLKHRVCDDTVGACKGSSKETTECNYGSCEVNAEVMIIGMGNDHDRGPPPDHYAGGYGGPYGPHGPPPHYEDRYRDEGRGEAVGLVALDDSRGREFKECESLGRLENVMGTVAQVRGGNRVTVCGGESPRKGGGPTRDCYGYGGRGRWEQESFSLRKGRSFAASVLLEDGSMMVFGGFSGGRKTLKSTEVLSDDNFKKGPDMPYASGDLCAVRVNSWQVFVAGGIEAQRNEHKKAYMLDVKGSKWTKLPNMAKERVRHVCGVYGGREVVVVGGMSNSKSTEIFSLEKGKWRKGPETPKGIHMDMIAGAQYGLSTFFVLGGTGGDSHYTFQWRDGRLEWREEKFWDAEEHIALVVSDGEKWCNDHDDYYDKPPPHHGPCGGPYQPPCGGGPPPGYPGGPPPGYPGGPPPGFPGGPPPYG